MPAKLSKLSHSDVKLNFVLVIKGSSKQVKNDIVERQIKPTDTFEYLMLP